MHNSSLQRGSCHLCSAALFCGRIIDIKLTPENSQKQPKIAGASRVVQYHPKNSCGFVETDSMRSKRFHAIELLRKRQSESKKEKKVEGEGGEKKRREEEERRRRGEEEKRRSVQLSHLPAGICYCFQAYKGNKKSQRANATAIRLFLVNYRRQFMTFLNKLNCERVQVISLLIGTQGQL